MTAVSAEPAGPGDPTVRTVRTGDGVALHVEEDGPADAPVTAVFVHGYCLNLDSWCLQRLGLAEPDGPPVRRVFYDLRSHGRSARAPSDTATLDRLADDLGDLVRAVAPGGRVVLVGHSLGGMVVLALAERQPELFTGPAGIGSSGPPAPAPRVAGVALLATSTGRWSASAVGLPALFARVHGSLTAPLAHRLVGQLARGLRWRAALLERTRLAGRNVVLGLTRRLSFGPAQVQPWLVDHVCTMICATPVEVIADFLPAVAGPDRRAVLDALRGVPTLILVGDRDRLTPVAHSRALAGRLSDPDLVVLPGAGHMVIMEQPDLVNAHLRALLARAAPAGEPEPA